MIESVGIENGSVERGVGVLERVSAGQFQRSIDGAQAALDLCEGFGTDAADLSPGLGDTIDLLPRRPLRPGERVENGLGRVAKVGLEFRALGDEPLPVDIGLENADDLVEDLAQALG